MLTNDDAWQRLPGAPPTAEPLPAWARMLAGPLPKATAAMLNLDALHRTGDRLDPVLRARLRLAAADANRCAYARAAARADLRRAGGTDAPASDAERAALDFAAKLAADPARLTDAEVKRLIELHGDRAVVAMVALVAHAAFQDRLLLALDPPVEGDGPPPPVAARFPHTRTQAGPPPKPGARPAETPAAPGVAVATPGPEWAARSIDDLQQGMERQKARPSRIRIPDWTEVGPKLTADSWGHRLPRVVWNRVCYAHQPELADAWFDCVDAFRQETRMDRMLTQDLFWVVTRTIDCFY